MGQIYTYEQDPYRVQMKASVTSAGRQDGRPYAELNDTLFYPEGGGQPADRGVLGGVAVVDVQKVEGVPRHFLQQPVDVGPVNLVLDWERRFDHMQQHTAQHLLTAVALNRFGWKTTAFHLRDRESDIELDVESLSQEQLEALEGEVMDEVRRGRKVRGWRVTPEEYAAMEVRSRRLPAGHQGDFRLVEIEGLDLNTCGGTHLHSVSEIECLKLLGTESMRGGTRLRWLAGGRVRKRLAQHEERNSRLRSLFDTGDEDLVEVAGLKLNQLKQAGREIKQLNGRLAEATVAHLATRQEKLVESHFEETEMSFLQQVARGFASSKHPGVLFLTASRGAGHFFVLAMAKDRPYDLPAMGRAVLSSLDGRGGGAGQMFQGKMDSLAGREQALTILGRYL